LACLLFQIPNASSNPLATASWVLGVHEINHLRGVVYSVLPVYLRETKNCLLGAIPRQFTPRTTTDMLRFSKFASQPARTVITTPFKPGATEHEHQQSSRCFHEPNRWKDIADALVDALEGVSASDAELLAKAFGIKRQSAILAVNKYFLVVSQSLRWQQRRVILSTCQGVFCYLIHSF
jgi:hypothetical protein